MACFARLQAANLHLGLVAEDRVFKIDGEIKVQGGFGPIECDRSRGAIGASNVMTVNAPLATDFSARKSVISAMTAKKPAAATVSHIGNVGERHI